MFAYGVFWQITWNVKSKPHRYTHARAHLRDFFSCSKNQTHNVVRQEKRQLSKDTYDRTAIDVSKKRKKTTKRESFVQGVGAIRGRETDREKEREWSVSVSECIAVSPQFENWKIVKIQSAKSHVQVNRKVSACLSCGEWMTRLISLLSLFNQLIIWCTLLSECVRVYLRNLDFHFKVIQPNFFKAKKKTSEKPVHFKFPTKLITDYLKLAFPCFNAKQKFWIGNHTFIGNKITF